MKILKTILPFCFMVILLMSCSDKKAQSPLFNEKLTVDNIVSLAEKVKDDKDFSREDMDLFSNGLARLSSHGADSVVGKTVGEIIQYQKNELLNTSVDGVKRSATRAEIIMAHKFLFRSINKFDTLDQKTNVVYFNLTNLSNQEIKEVRGFLNVVNQQNQIVKKYPIEVITPLESGKEYQLKTKPYKHDDNNQFDMLIRTAGDKLKPIWQPIAIKFADGKLLNLGQ